MTLYTTLNLRFHTKYLLPSVLITLVSMGHAQESASTGSKPAAASKSKAAKSSSSSSSSTSSSSSSEAAKAKAASPAVAPKAEVAKTPEAPAKAVDFTAKDLWDKELFERDDNKVLVIQDRKYNKGGRLELGADIGKTAATAFYNSYSVGLRTAYYLNEYWGIQGFGNYSFNSETNEKEQLENFLYDSNFASTKEFLQPKLFAGLGVIWNPIYGKFAWFRSRIIHFDIYGGAGISMLTMDSTFNRTKVGGGVTREGESQTAFGSLLNLGIRIFISKNLAWTTEVRNNIYQAKYLETTTGGGGSVIAAKKVLQNNFQFTTGVSYLFNIGGY